MIDRSIGQILKSLDKLGLADNTMVIFTSDHGDFMGDHGILLKGPAPFNGVLQVPLIWKVPEITQEGGESSSLINSKEMHQPPHMQGYDMTPILKNPGKKIRDRVLIV